MVAEGLPTIARNSRGCPSSTTLDPALDDERAHRRRLARSTAVFGAATALSRVLGLVREMVAAYSFGAAGKINAFTVAFQIPNLVRALVADTALSGAFVPVFSELLEKGERAPRVARRVDDLLARPALHDGADGDLRARGAADRRAVRRRRAATSTWPSASRACSSRS